MGRTRRPQGVRRDPERKGRTSVVSMGTGGVVHPAGAATRRANRMSAALDSLNTSWMAAEPLSVITVAVAAATDGRVQRLARLLDRKGMLVTRTFAGFDEPVAELPQAEQDCYVVDAAADDG